MGTPYLPNDFPSGDPVDVPHEATGVESQVVVAFLELVEFLDDGDRYHQVVVLKLADGLVVVQDDVRVKYEDFGLPAALAPCRGFGISCHINNKLSVFSFGCLAVEKRLEYGGYPAAAGLHVDFAGAGHG